MGDFLKATDLQSSTGMSKQIDPAHAFASIFENTTDALVGADRLGQIILFNPAAERMFRRPAQKVLGQELTCLMPKTYQAGHGHHVSGYFKRAQESDLIGKPRRMIGQRPDGSEFPIELSLAKGDNGGEPFVLAVVRDISAREVQDQQLKESQDRFERAVAGSREGIWDWNLTNNTVYFAPRWKELLGIEDPQIGTNPDEWFRRIVSNSLAEFYDSLTTHLEGRSETFDVELEMRHEDGSIRWMLCRALATRDASGKATSIAGSMADITELKKTQEELRRIGLHDRLTELPNRSLLYARIREAIATAAQDSSHLFALLFFDFDRFKVVNDGLGHNTGDALLVSIATRLRKHLREQDCVARFGGDEFVVLLDGVNDLNEVKDLCATYLSVLSDPHHIHGYEIVSTASIGVTTSEHGYKQPEDMIRDADAAMFHAKSSGRNNYRMFDKAMHARAVEQVQIDRDLRRKPFDSEFKVVYQPIVSLESGAVAGFEALVRWEHPTRGLLSPNTFIPIAEETGLIVPLGEFVLQRACDQIIQWRSDFGQDVPLFVNVNISKRQLVHPDLIESLQVILDQTGVNPADLKLEVTETALMDERNNLIPTMKQICELGIPLAMDDFGTGQSSLSCLHRFPIDVLKIDRSFIVNMEQHRQFGAVVQSIILLAQNMQMQVVAEGVENREQLAQLQTMDCQYAQGYLFAPPLPVAEATDYLGRRWENSSFN